MSRPCVARRSAAGLTRRLAALAAVGTLLAAGVTPGRADEAAATPAMPSHPRTKVARLWDDSWRLAHEDERRFLRRRTADILLGGAALSGACVTFEDADRQARSLSGSPWRQVADVGNTYGNAVTLGVGALALLGTGQAVGDRNARDAGFEAGRALAYTYGIVGGLKLATRRPRPDGGDYSFPSGHAAGAFAVAPVLARRFGPVVAVPAYALAVAAVIGRLEARRHYLSDVVFGAALGTSVGLAVAGPHDRPTRVGLRVGPASAGIAVGF